MGWATHQVRKRQNSLEFLQQHNWFLGWRLRLGHYRHLSARAQWLRRARTRVRWPREKFPRPVTRRKPVALPPWRQRNNPFTPGCSRVHWLRYWPWTVCLPVLVILACVAAVIPPAEDATRGVVLRRVHRSCLIHVQEIRRLCYWPALPRKVCRHFIV